METIEHTISFLIKHIYTPVGLVLQELTAEEQNAEYEGCTFMLDESTVRFRTAKVTQKKIGQFVAIWEKDEHNKNRPFFYEQSPEFLVVNTFTVEHKGQFVFPKKVLLEKGVLSSKSKKGKMAIRVYPAWDTPASKQAIATQKWQQPFFLDFTEALHLERVEKLYEMKSSE